MAKSGLAKSTSEARRLINQSAVKIGGEKYIAFSMLNPHKDFVIQAGKAKFIKVKINNE
jgi:tyrosyl-tRNA synthetase